MAPTPRQSGAIKVRTVFEHGQWYAIASGRGVDQLTGRRRGWFVRPTVASIGPTPEAAIEDVALMLAALRGSVEPDRKENPDAR
jgi:hypothetical protein